MKLLLLLLGGGGGGLGDEIKASFRGRNPVTGFVATNLAPASKTAPTTKPTSMSTTSSRVFVVDRIVSVATAK